MGKKLRVVIHQAYECVSFTGCGRDWIIIYLLDFVLHYPQSFSGAQMSLEGQGSDLENALLWLETKSIVFRELEKLSGSLIMITEGIVSYH